MRTSLGSDLLITPESKRARSRVPRLPIAGGHYENAELHEHTVGARIPAHDWPQSTRRPAGRRFNSTHELHPLFHAFHEMLAFRAS
jgi:hypothetical protein